jgi:hypothetical protein
MVDRIDSQAFDAPVNGCAIVRSDPAKLDGIHASSLLRLVA